MFMNLLHCMEMTLDEVALNEVETRFCYKNKAHTYVKYESALKVLKYDNSTESWTYLAEKV